MVVAVGSREEGQRIKEDYVQNFTLLGKDRKNYYLTNNGFELLQEKAYKCKSRALSFSV